MNVTTTEQDTLRKLYVREHPLALVICGGLAFSAALVGIVPGLVSQSRVAAAAPASLTYLWLAMVFVGGAGAAFGIVSFRQRIEAAALLVLGSAIAVQALATLDVAGSAAVIGVTIQFTVAIGLGVRAITLWQGLVKGRRDRGAIRNR